MTVPRQTAVLPGIRVEAVPCCPICGKRGETRYDDLRDRLFSAPGAWSLRLCPHDGHLWLDPRPVAADLGELYTSYYTHAESGVNSLRQRLKQIVERAVREATFGYGGDSRGLPWRVLRRLISWLPVARAIGGSSVMWLHARHRGRLLDVGCGTGVIAGTLRDLGWDVYGVEPDPRAGALAQRRLGSERVAIGTLDTVDLPASSFDVMTAQQVIEHVPDPLAFLSHARRLLRQGGRVVLTTPNAHSLCHRRFGRNWRELDPPRHLHLFSLSDLSTCASRVGLIVESARTTARTAWEVWCASRALQANAGSFDGGTLPRGLTMFRRLQGYLFQLFEHTLVSTGVSVGEVLVFVARRP